jgi:hypothetical protein
MSWWQGITGALVMGLDLRRAFARFPLIGFAAVLCACSSQIYEPTAPQGDPPTKQKILENIPQIFSDSSHPTDILVTAARPAVEQGLFGWLVCVRARVVVATGQDGGFQTIAVFYQRREMVLRRRAEPKDSCEGFERLASRSRFNSFAEHGPGLPPMAQSSSPSRKVVIKGRHASLIPRIG